MCVSSIWIELQSISALSLINGSYYFRCEVCIVTVLGKIGEASPVGCTHGKAAQRSTKDQVAWLHLRPCLAPPWRGSQQNYQRLLWTVRHSESPRAVVLNPFHTSYPFLKQDYQIFPQFTQRCWVIENTKLTNKLFQFRMIYRNWQWLQFMVQWIYPQVYIYPGLKTTVLWPLPPRPFPDKKRELKWMNVLQLFSVQASHPRCLPFRPNPPQANPLRHCSKSTTLAKSRCL